MIYPPEIQEFLEKYDRIFLDERGIIKLQSADFYKTIDNTDLRVWCICRAIYQLPTVELIEWLKENFNLDKAIEIGAGNNYLYHHLGIKGVDNYSEQISAVKLVHEILNQPSTDPPPAVEKLDAIANSIGILLFLTVRDNRSVCDKLFFFPSKLECNLNILGILVLTKNQSRRF